MHTLTLNETLVDVNNNIIDFYHLLCFAFLPAQQTPLSIPLSLSLSLSGPPHTL